MARMMLSLETLKDFDMGRASEAWALALKKVVQDLLDRPGDNRARKVLLTCTITPILLQEGDVVDAEVEFSIARKVPEWQTKPRPVAITQTQQLVFNDMAMDNPHQTTIDE